MRRGLEMARFWEGVTDSDPYDARSDLSGSFPLQRQGSRAGVGTGRGVCGLDRLLSGHSASGKAAREIGEQLVAGALPRVRIQAVRRSLRCAMSNRSGLG